MPSDQLGDLPRMAYGKVMMAASDALQLCVGQHRRQPITDCQGADCVIFSPQQQCGRGDGWQQRGEIFAKLGDPRYGVREFLRYCGRQSAPPKSSTGSPPEVAVKTSRRIFARDRSAALMATKPPMDCAIRSTGPNMWPSASSTRSSIPITSSLCGSAPSPGQDNDWQSQSAGNRSMTGCQNRALPPAPGEEQLSRHLSQLGEGAHRVKLLAVQHP